MSSHYDANPSTVLPQEMESPSNVVLFPAEGRSRMGPADLSNQGAVVDLFAGARSPQWWCKAWEGWDRHSLEQEMQGLFQRQMLALDLLSQHWAQTEAQQEAIQAIQTLNQSLANGGMDCLKAETCQSRKQLLAAAHQLPAAYLQMESIQWNLQTINRTLITLFAAAEELGSDAIYYALTPQRLTELSEIKQHLYQVLVQAEERVQQECLQSVSRLKQTRAVSLLNRVTLSCFLDWVRPLYQGLSVGFKHR
ncbi:MAG: hypothetical protein SFZ03_02910 [Candidatus Melainabacteria bacterium]|nr:hypothetical protein [Candidatus Melainabacteria bacterium]